jgi:DNA-binding CsgD family transcriptional regulator
LILPLAVRAWVAKASKATATPAPVAIESGPRKLQIAFLARTGPDQFMLRLTEENPGGAQNALKEKLGLTNREAEVLLWLARGKSNRDIAEILGLSPRTVNKHLEQVYSKLGVENRASATARATQVWAG